MTDDSVPTYSGARHYELEEIYGLGLESAKTLDEIGIRSFADLARFDSPAELHDYLADNGVNSIPLWRIENRNSPQEYGDWLQEAKKKSPQIGSEHRLDDEVYQVQEEVVQTAPTLLADESQAQERSLGKSIQLEDIPSDLSGWEQRAGFTLFFDLIRNAQGKEVWRTRVYHLEDYLVGQEEVEPESFLGIEAKPWVRWILHEVELPAEAFSQVERHEVQGELGAELAIASGSPNSVAKERALAEVNRELEIFKVDVSEIGPSSGTPEKRLVAQIGFKLLQPMGDAVAGYPLSFRVEIHLVDLVNLTSNLVASETALLQTNVLTYESRQQFPLPEIGHYRFYCVVLLLPPGNLAAYYEGPIINIQP